MIHRDFKFIKHVQKKLHSKKILLVYLCQLMMILVIPKTQNDRKCFFYSGDANGLDEPEFFRKLQPSLHVNAQNSNIDLDSTKKPILFFLL